MTIEYGRRPYMAEEDYSEMMKRKTDAVVFNNSTEAHSELKKPYNSESYEEMEYYYSPYGVKPYDPLPFYPSDPTNPDPNNLPDPYNPWGSRLCVDGGPMGVVPDNPILNPGQLVVFTVSGSALETPDYFWDDPTIFGSISNINGSSTTFTARMDVHGDHTSHITVTDGLCTMKVYFTITATNDCDATPVMTWDSINSAETILQSGSATIYVNDGVGFYTYSVIGTGYSFTNGLTSYSTDSKFVTIFADPTSCGSAEITVTDFCGTVVTGGVRNTDSGIWSTISNCGVLDCSDFVFDISLGIKETLTTKALDRILSRSYEVGNMRYFYNEILTRNASGTLETCTEWPVGVNCSSTLPGYPHSYNSTQISGSMETWRYSAQLASGVSTFIVGSCIGYNGHPSVRNCTNATMTSIQKWVCVP